MNPITHRNREIERLELELAEKDAQITKLTAQLRIVKDSEKIHQEQHAQSRENAKLLYTTLRRAAPDALKSIEGMLWQSINEYDKLMSEGRRWQDKFQRSEIELAESREECRRLREALEPFVALSNEVLTWNTNGGIVRTDEAIFYAVNDFALRYGDLRKITTMFNLAPKVGDK